MEKINQIVKETILPILRRAGFKKKGLLWNRQRDHFIDVLDVQESKGSSSICEQFTINVGVFVPEFFAMVWQQPYSGFALEPDCPVRSRIGAIIEDDFSGATLDKWWSLDSEGDVPSVSSEITTVLEDKVLPFFDKVKNIEDIHAFIVAMGGWQKQYPLMQIYFALVKRKLGDNEGCNEILSSIIDGKNKAWAKRAELVKKQLH